MLALAWLLTSLACCPCFRINSQNPAWDIVDEIQNKNGAEICRILQQEYRDQLQSNETVFEVVMEAFREETNMKHVALLRCLEEAVNISLSTVRSPYDETLLFPAARSGRLKALEYLIAKGVPLNEINKDGYSAAEEGIVHKKCPQCLSKLLGAGVKPDQASLRPCSSFSKRIFVCSAGRTLAHFAAQHNAPESLEVLQEHGANLSALDDAGFSPAHVAVRHMELEALKELGKLNASFNSTDHLGRTPAHLACQYGRNALEVNKSLEIIRDSQGRLDGKDVNNDTPAHYCASGVKNVDGNTFPKALRILHDAVPESFQTKNLQQQTPESLTIKEGNKAEIYFAQHRALILKKLKEEAERYADAATRFAIKSKQQTEETEALRQAENEMEQKCQDLSKEVNALFDCSADKSIIRVPKGFMILWGPFCAGNESRPTESCAVLCPNHLACPKHEMIFKQKQLERADQCIKGYDDNFPGCSRCSHSYGRQREDPFQCKLCGSFWKGWAVYVAKPLGIFSVSLWTAQKVERDRMGSFLKIWLAFCLVVASISPVIKASDQFQSAYQWLWKGTSSGEEVASIGTGMSGPSYDCLLGDNNASIHAWLGLAFAPVLVLWCVSVLSVLARTLVSGAVEVQALMKSILKISIVITNCFLPDMVAALLRYFPCVHFQHAGDSARYMQFDVLTNCGDVKWTRLGAVFAAFVLCSFLGPVCWVAVIQRSQEWKDRKDTLAFLISGYRLQVSWWETTVLIRKCAMAAAVAVFSASYAPMLYLSSILFIVALGLACHAYVQPYEDPTLNRIEFGTLAASFMAVFCTFLLKLESIAWAVDDGVAFPALLILFVVVIGPFVGLMVLYLKEMRPERFTRMLLQRFRWNSSPEG